MPLLFFRNLQCWLYKVWFCVQKTVQNQWPYLHTSWKWKMTILETSYSSSRGYIVVSTISRFVSGMVGGWGRKTSSEWKGPHVRSVGQETSWLKRSASKYWRWILILWCQPNVWQIGTQKCPPTPGTEYRMAKKGGQGWCQGGDVWCAGFFQWRVFFLKEVKGDAVQESGPLRQQTHP